MSSKRNRERGQRGALRQENTTLDDVTDAIFGSELRAVDPTIDTVRAIDIFKIYPNVVQPRRALPSFIRQHWDGSPSTIAQVLEVWREAVHRESNVPFDLGLYLDNWQDAEAERPEIQGPLTASFLSLVGLAGSIRRDGLTNPITVVRESDHYRIETGERRWLAYHLLYAYSHQNERWQKIPARIMPAIDLWRQANENNARNDLNAVGKARQLALLLMDLHGWDNFRTYDELVAEGDCDRPFYAQVADGNEYRVPRGKGEQLLQAMGLSHTKQLRDYRALLRLPNDVWIRADDQNSSEHELRQFTVPMGTLNKDSDSSQPPVPRERFVMHSDVRARLKTLLNLRRRVTEMTDNERAFLLEDVESIKIWLLNFEEQLLNSMKD